MNGAEEKHKHREIEIAHNEAKRQTMSDVRVSVWAVIAVVLAICIAGWFLIAMK